MSLTKEQIAEAVYHWCIIQGWGDAFAHSQKMRVLNAGQPAKDWLEDLMNDVKKGQNDRWKWN